MYTQANCDSTNIEKLLQERTGSNFTNDSHEESFCYEVEAEKEYVHRLKLQREKIEGLYNKYDILLNQLKSRDHLLKDKDSILKLNLGKIIDLENKCKSFSLQTEESIITKQQSTEIKNQNVHLKSNLNQLEQQYAILHNHFKNKEQSSIQKQDQLTNINEELIQKIKSISKKCQEKDLEFKEKSKEMAGRLDEFKNESKAEKQKLLQELDSIRDGVLKKDEEISRICLQNECLKERLAELEIYTNDIAQEYEEKIEKINKDKKSHLKIMKNELAACQQHNSVIEKNVLKLKSEISTKDSKLSEMAILFQEFEKKSNEDNFCLRQQHAQQKNVLKEQIIYCESHIGKLERKLTDCFKKQKDFQEVIRKYEVCMDAKRSLREIEREELQKINLLLNLQ